jgi:preprotein translocase subunit SecB
MRVSPLRLEGYYVKELHVSIQEKWKLQSEYPAAISPEDIAVTILAGQHKEKPRERFFEVTVELQKQAIKRYPYNFKTTLVGYFEISEQFPAEHAETMVKANAPALLYSAARELIASTTGRGLFPALTLPSVTFIEPPKTSKAVKKASPKTSAKAAPKKTKKKRA